MLPAFQNLKGAPTGLKVLQKVEVSYSLISFTVTVNLHFVWRFQGTLFSGKFYLRSTFGTYKWQIVPEAGQLTGEQAQQGHTSNPGSTGWDPTGTGSLPQVITQVGICLTSEHCVLKKKKIIHALVFWVSPITRKILEKPFSSGQPLLLLSVVCLLASCFLLQLFSIALIFLTLQMLGNIISILPCNAVSIIAAFEVFL